MASEPPRKNLPNSGADVAAHDALVAAEQQRNQLERELAERVEELQREQELLSVLADAGTALASSLDSRAALAELARCVVPRLADWCAIDELDPEGRIRRLVVVHRDPEKVELAQRLFAKYPPRAEDLHGVGAVLRTGQRDWVANLSEELIVQAACDEEHVAIIRALQLTSYAVVPLRSHGRIWGALSLVCENERKLTARQLVFAEELGSRAALALENARLYEEQVSARRVAQEHAATLTTVNELGHLISAELDQDKVVQAVTDVATKLTGAQFGAFFYNVIDDHGGRYMLYTLSGVSREAFANFPMPRNTEVFAPTFGGAGVVRVADITADARYGKSAPYHGMPKGHLPVRSYLAAPVVSRSGEVIGGIFLGHAQVNMFDERAEMMAVGLAAQAAVAMDNARLYTQAQRLIRALESTNRELDQFAYVTSHDLKAPLRGIHSLAEWIEEDLGPALNEESRSKMRLLRGRVKRMESLIQGVLDFARVGRKVEKLEQVDTDKLVNEVIELLAPAAPANVVITSPMPIVPAQRIVLQQVFLNLIGNALKHAGRADVTVSISATETEDAFEFSVRDDGVGIAAEYHERVWSIFQTLASRDRVESTGIGLAIVKKIVEGRGGRAWLQSAEHAGATFGFSWPKQPGTL